MEIYLVGGAVRDALLDLEVTERDWVVVGATPEEMIRLGFQPVGKDFPVFLHPQTHEEYALARTERKTGKGYKGFVFYSAPDVSLAEDLKRRDLTINAMAQTSSGAIIDPYGGQEDLKNLVLRHVSSAFQEDPVRVLRIARFAARFTDFKIHPETLTLMHQMVVNGEVNALVAERVWQEFARALESIKPIRFLMTLQECGALAVLFPELKLTPQTLTAFENAVQVSESPIVRFAALVHELCETTIKNFCQRYRVPKEYTDLALHVSRWYLVYQHIPAQTSAQEVFYLLKSADARRRPERFRQFLLVCNACSQFTNSAAGIFLETCAAKIQALDIQSLQTQGLTGNAFVQALEQWQLQVVQTELQRIS